MKKLILIASFCVTTGIVFAQEPFKDENGKFGFKLNNEIIIKAKFEESYNFKEGLAIVKLNNKYGFIDLTGKEIVEIKYELIYPFVDNITAVKYNNKWGFIDKTGKIIIPFKYDKANTFSEGMSMVSYFDKDFKTTYTYVNKEGIELPYRFRNARDFKDGLAIVEFEKTDGYRSLEGEGYGIIDYSGKYVVEPKYHEIYDFENGFALVKMVDAYMNKLYGYIDKKGNEIIKPIYAYQDRFDGGFILKSVISYGVLDNFGQEIIPFNEKYDNIKYSNGFFFITHRDRKVEKLKLNKQGKQIKMHAQNATNQTATSIPDKPEVALVLGGSFEMGERYTHNVTLSSYNLGKYPVTVSQYKKYCLATGTAMPTEPSWGWSEKQPIVNVNYNDAIAYCKWLGETYGGDWRLPTEAEWEFAVRGGNKTKNFIYSGSDYLEEVAWAKDNRESKTIGGKSPNELGIYDLGGLVSEWCKDWYKDNFIYKAQTNPTGPTSGTDRLLRGGCWVSYSGQSVGPDCYVVSRGGHNPDFRANHIGFRVVLSQ